MARLRYEIDPHNRLVVWEVRDVRGRGRGRRGRKKSGVHRFRRVMEGKFKTGKGGTLLYHIKAPTGSGSGDAADAADELDLPHQMKFKGKWSLTEDHNLRLTLDKWRRQTFGDSLTLKGEIIKVDAHSLLFTVTQRTKENVTSTHMLKLEGSWQADENNRLTFRMKREKAGYDVLVFDSIWEINKRHKIIYNYERRVSSRGERKKQSLSFSGFWDYAEKDVLTYQLDVKGEPAFAKASADRSAFAKASADRSAFDFRIGRRVMEGRAIKFEVGIGISRRENPVKKDIILYGRWRVREGAGLIFETKYGGGRLSAMKFEAEAKLIGSSRIKFALKNREGRDLDTEFTISKALLKGRGESFIRFLRRGKEKAVYLGAGCAW